MIYLIKDLFTNEIFVRHRLKGSIKEGLKDDEYQLLLVDQPSKTTVNNHTPLFLSQNTWKKLNLKDKTKVFIADLKFKYGSKTRKTL